MVVRVVVRVEVRVGGVDGSGGGNRAIGTKLFILPLYSKFLKLQDDSTEKKKNEHTWEIRHDSPNKRKEELIVSLGTNMVSRVTTSQEMVHTYM